MELHNFEHQAKEKLSKREIAPSTQAWDRLDAMLSVQEKSKKKTNWWFVAASITGLMLVGMLFVNTSKNTNTITPSKEIVVTAAEDKDSDTIKSSIDSKEGVKFHPKSTLLTNDSWAIHNPKKTIKKAHQEFSINNEFKNSDNQVSTTVEKSTIQQSITKVDENEPIVLTTIPKDKKIKVDPSILLSQVDGELELSFREKMIVKVNKNYQTLKIALVNRNNQE